MHTRKRILFVGGGSGGHITPNIALIKYLLTRQSFHKEDILYVGTKTGMEKEIVGNKGIPFQGISAGKLRRYFDWKNFSDIFKVVIGIIQAYRIIHIFKPHIVFSKGGFVSVPVVLGAWLHRVPVVTHESDSVSGLANRIIKHFARKICLTFPQSTYDTKEVLTGLPVRQEILKGSKERGCALTGVLTDKPTLLVLGGSLGAMALNEFVWGNVEQLLQMCNVIHVVGKGNLKELRIRKDCVLKYAQEKNSSVYVQYEFLEKELADVYAISDLILSRAGATTIAECAQLQKACILIPLTTGASRGEQIANARWLENKKVAVILAQELLSNKGTDYIKDLLKDKNRREILQKNISSLFPKDACESIYKILRTIRRN